jgi:hypothetical protein
MPAPTTTTRALLGSLLTATDISDAQETLTAPLRSWYKVDISASGEAEDE